MYVHVSMVLLYMCTLYSVQVVHVCTTIHIHAEVHVHVHVLLHAYVQL